MSLLIYLGDVWWTCREQRSNPRVVYTLMRRKRLKLWYVGCMVDRRHVSNKAFVNKADALKEYRRYR